MREVLAPSSDGRPPRAYTRPTPKNTMSAPRQRRRTVRRKHVGAAAGARGGREGSAAEPAITAERGPSSRGWRPMSHCLCVVETERIRRVQEVDARRGACPRAAGCQWGALPDALACAARAMTLGESADGPSQRTRPVDETASPLPTASVPAPSPSPPPEWHERSGARLLLKPRRRRRAFLRPHAADASREHLRQWGRPSEYGARSPSATPATRAATRARASAQVLARNHGHHLGRAIRDERRKENGMARALTRHRRATERAPDTQRSRSRARCGGTVAAAPRDPVEHVVVRSIDAAS